MKFRCGLLALLMTAIVTAGCLRTQQKMTSVESTISADLDAAVKEGMNQEMYPGGVLIVGQPGKVLHAKAYGKKTFEEGAAPMEMDTIFDMASVSKVVGTATAAWTLLEEGKLDLDDEVAEYIPAFNSGGKEGVTIRDLMTHVSGLKAYDNRNVVEEQRREGELPADALIRRYANLEASYTPREKYVYSCLNFQTLARICEEASGQRLGDLLQARVYGPLGMDDTRYLLSDEQKARVAPSHRLDSGENATWQVHDPLANYHGSDMHCPGNAGLFSSAPDLAKYCEMVLQDGYYNGREIVSPGIMHAATKVQMPSEVDEDRGLGWDIYEVKPYMTDLNKSSENHVIGHTGYTGTMIWLDKKTDTYFVFLTNRTYPAEEGANDQTPSISPIRKKIADIILRSMPDYEDYFATQDPYKIGG